MKTLLRAAIAAIALASVTSCADLNINANTKYGTVQTNPDGSFTIQSKPIPLKAKVIRYEK